MEFSKERQLRKRITPIKSNKRPYKRMRNNSIKFNTRTKATDITKNTRRDVLVRDNGKCIFCGTIYSLTMCHVIPRSKMGLGIEQNLVSGCLNCHHEFDNTINRPKYMAIAKEYLKRFYPLFKDEDRVYKKWR